MRNSKTRYFTSGKTKIKLPPLPKKPKPHPKNELAQSIATLDLPHLRLKGSWRTKSSLGVTQEYAEQLRKIKMRKGLIGVLIADLYWAAYKEFLMMSD